MATILTPPDAAAPVGIMCLLWHDAEDWQPPPNCQFSDCICRCHLATMPPLMHLKCGPIGDSHRIGWN